MIKGILNRESEWGVSLLFSWHFYFSGLLFISVFSGNFNLSEFFFEEKTWLLNVRLISTVLLFLSLSIYCILDGFESIFFKKLFIDKANLLILFFSCLVAFSAINNSNNSSTIFHAIINVISLVVFIVLLSKFSLKIIDSLSVIGLLFGFLWASVYFKNIYSEGFQLGMIPFGTSFTYYRILAFSTLSSLYLLFRFIQPDSINWKATPFLCFTIIFLTVAVSYSMSKASWIAAFLGYLTVVLLLVFHHKYKRAALVAFLGVISGVLVYTLPASQVMEARYQGLQGTGYHGIQKDYLRELRDTEPGMQSFFEFNEIVPDYSHRIKLFRESMLVEHPFWGNGVGSFEFQGRNLYTKDLDLYTYPHNIFLEIYNSLGLFGTSIFGLIIVLCLFDFFKLDYRTQIALSPFIGLSILYGVGAMFGGDLTDFNFFWFTMVLLISHSKTRNLGS